MRLFLIRHGDVIPPAPGAFYGGTEVELSPRGKQEAQAAARLLTPEEFTAVYSSPLSRARYGAEQILRGRPQLELQLIPEIREIDRGRWTGQTPSEVESSWPGDLQAHQQDPEAWKGHGGESLGELRNRCLAVRDRLQRKHQEETVALVSHLFPTRAILADALGLPLDRWASLRLPTGSVSLIEFGPTGTRVHWQGRCG